MKTKELTIVPDVKGTKRGQNSADQLTASIARENAKEGSTKKTVYLRPKTDSKIDDFFKYAKQVNNRMFEVDMLEAAVIAKYSDEFGISFARSLFYDACEFTHCFNADIVTKVDDETVFTDISYFKNDVEISRYLVDVDDSNVCSVFRHFMDYAKATGRQSVELLLQKEAKERKEAREQKTAEKREAKEVEKAGKKIQEMTAEQILSMLTAEQIAALQALQAAK